MILNARVTSRFFESFFSGVSMILQTRRLFFRELTQADLRDLKEILQDPEVVYAYEHEFTDADVQAWLDRQRMRYARYGFGLWALILKETGEMVGQAGLTMQPVDSEEVLEIGYLLKKRFWHNGYACEAAEACRQYAFAKLNADKVYSIIRTDNISSMRVARKIGMRKEREFTARYYHGDMPHCLFFVERT